MGNNHPQKYINSFFTDDPVFPTNLICSLQTTCQPTDDSGLYDFDQQAASINSLILKNEGHLMRSELTTTFQNDHVTFTHHSTKLPYTLQYHNIHENNLYQMVEGSSTLAQVYQTKSGMMLKNMGSDGSNINDLWMVLKKTDPKTQHAIQVDDQFKLGRIRLRVIEMSKVEQQRHHQIDYAHLEKYSSYKSVQNCRICLSVEEGSPLIRPCNCMGSVAFIHVNCLREWFRNKIQAQKSDLTKKGGVTYYAWKNLECEICTKQYQYNFEVEGLKFQLFDMEKPKGPYILFESLTKDRNSLKGLYLVDLTYTNTITMGRGQDIDMRLLDISVSREHTILHHNKGKFYINDAGSKFGTVLLVRDPINMCAHLNAQFLSAQTLFTFDVKLRKENMSCFKGVEKKKTPKQSLAIKQEMEGNHSHSFQFQYDKDDNILELQGPKLFPNFIDEGELNRQKLDLSWQESQHHLSLHQFQQEHGSKKVTSLTSIFAAHNKMNNSVNLDEQLEESGISTQDLLLNSKLTKTSAIFSPQCPTKVDLRQESQGQQSLIPLQVSRSKSTTVKQTDDDCCDQYLKFSRLMLDDEEL